MKLELVKQNHPALRQRAEELNEVTDEVRTIAKEMLRVMYEGNGETTGMGLAANQVGLRIRLIVVDGSRSKSQPIVMVNPEILKAKGEQTWGEGCLSFPGQLVKVKRAKQIVVKYSGQLVKVKRAKQIVVKYFDLDEHEEHVSFSGLMAQCIQHEIDHLNGICIVDYLEGR